MVGDDRLSELEEEESVSNTHVHADLGAEHKGLLNVLANSHYGGNKTTCLRMALEVLKRWHLQDKEQRHWSDETRQELVEQTDLLQTVLQTLQELEGDIMDLRRDSPLPEGFDPGESNDATGEIYSSLKDADQPLSVDGLLERTDLSLSILGEGIESLLDIYVIEDCSEGGDTPRYKIRGATHGN